MSYRSLEECLADLEKNDMLVRIREEVDPYLQMAAIHLRVHAAGGPALLFEKVKGSKFRAASNVFGTLPRSEFIFRDTLPAVQQLISLRNSPIDALKNPGKAINSGLTALNSFPMQDPFVKPVFYEEIKLSELPQVTHWPKDGGAFITLPQVYTEDSDHPGWKRSNLGMYRIQLSGNEYIPDQEAGLHYQIHRGIGIHQSKAEKKNIPLRVSIFVGGPPANSIAAVMPLPENMSEIRFAGMLGGRRFRYTYQNDFFISTDADFVITGIVNPGETKPEGPFGDHLGYYSLKHSFPLLKVHKVYAKKNAIWPFTVVGRPPQEDTSFGQLIHKIAGPALQVEIPGLKELNAVDAAGVHPLLLAIGSERYTPFMMDKHPAELLTIASHILGTGQLSLAKFLFITCDDNNMLDTKDIRSFFQFILKRWDPARDIHFLTKTTIDTLDYSGTALNAGSKVIIAAYGEPARELSTEIPSFMETLAGFKNPRLVMPGIIALETDAFTDYPAATKQFESLEHQLKVQLNVLKNFPLIIVSDNSDFLSKNLDNFLWVTFTRSNPSHDMYGIGSFTEFKHWGCTGPIVLDARKKPHHAPPLEIDSATQNSIQFLFEKGGSLYQKG